MLETLDLTQKLDRAEYIRQLARRQIQLRELGFQVYQQKRPVVLVFEGWDAAGKGGVIKRITEKLDPRGLDDFNTIVVKFWLHISREEQLNRFEERQRIGYKAWKLTDEDWRNREKWGAYEDAAEEMLVKTSTTLAPWTLVEANDKYWARVKVLSRLVEVLSKELNYKPQDPFKKSKSKS